MTVGNENPKDQIIKRELNNLNDIPRVFDEVLFKVLGISFTVMEYWKTIGFNPGYYHRLWLLKMSRDSLAYDMYGDIYDMLIPPMLNENRVIGEIFLEYRNNEKRMVNGFLINDNNYIYTLEHFFEDGSGGIDIITTKAEEWLDVMRKESRKNQTGFSVKKYYMENDGKDICTKNCIGQFDYNNYGRLEHYIFYDDSVQNASSDLIMPFPYVLLPHPFDSHDLVQYTKYGEYYTGIIRGVSRQDEEKQLIDRGLVPDGYDVCATVENVFRQDDGRYSFFHSHISPYCLDWYFVDDKSDQQSRILQHARNIVEEGWSDFETLMMLMDGIEVLT